MSDIYVNVETGKKIRLSQVTMVHVFDHENPRDILDFTDTDEGVAEWCMENLFGNEDNIDEIKDAPRYGDSFIFEIYEPAIIENIVYFNKNNSKITQEDILNDLKKIIKYIGGIAPCLRGLCSIQNRSCI